MSKQEIIDDIIQRYYFEWEEQVCNYLIEEYFDDNFNPIFTWADGQKIFEIMMKKVAN